LKLRKKQLQIFTTCATFIIATGLLFGLDSAGGL